MRLLVVYGSSTQPTVESDTSATPAAVVERDANGDSFLDGLALGSIAAAAPTTNGYFLSLLGALLMGADTQTGTVTLNNGNRCIQNLNAASAAFTATLPAAASSANLLYFCFKSDATGNVPTLKGSGSDNITAGGATANTYTGLTAKGSHVLLWCDGAQWWQIA